MRDTPFIWIDRQIVSDIALIGATAFAVYAAIVGAADGMRTAEMSLQSLADQVGVCRNTLRKALRTLDEHGMVTVTDQITDDGGTGCHKFTIVK